MKQTLVYGVGALLSLSALFVPFSASALGLSFGGRVLTWFPCVSASGPSFHFSIEPAGGDNNPLYIWAPGAVGLPPSHSGQEILGVADIPYKCCVGYVCSYGERVQIDGVSI